MQSKKINASLERWKQDCDLCHVRLVDIRSETLQIERGHFEPPTLKVDCGAMVTVFVDGGVGYGATSTLTEKGLQEAFEKAKSWAALASKNTIYDMRKVSGETVRGEYNSPCETHPREVPFSAKVALLKELSDLLSDDPSVVDYWAGIESQEETVTFWTSEGTEIRQKFLYTVPSMGTTVHRHGESVTRTHAGHKLPMQGGFERAEKSALKESARKVLQEACLLVEAPDCPNDTRHVILDPGQMVLQIHESIGHPIELDRILGDERNYAGTSFVTPEMFGEFSYGSSLLNITFDPTVEGELASYVFDDEGSRAERQYLIKNGTLLRGLGGRLSQARSGLKGVANSRAVGWQRPPMDRMANINMESGDSSLEELIAGIDKGILMRTNRSWSIDDSRNKFQFGCEFGQLIENGKLTTIVKNPNYRGISRSFWQKLVSVSDANTTEIQGSTVCGKGEPNQSIRVGHSTPYCAFKDIEVFGGQK